jgi:uncharacterized protein
MIFVDTGFFLAHLRRRDELHRRAESWVRALDAPLFTTEYVLWELLNGASAVNARRGAYALAVRCLTSDWCEVVPASPGLFARGMRLFAERFDKAWSLTDCVLFQVMRDRGVVRALNHDRHFEQAGFDPLLRRDPV